MQIVDQGDARKYWIQIPNLIDDLDLDPYEFRLYVHLKRVAGDNGKCWQSTATLAECCKMSTGKVSEVKASLAKKKLIIITETKRDAGGKPHHTITIVDIWPANMAHYSQKNQQSKPASSPREVASSPHEVASSPHEIKNIPSKNIPIEEAAAASKLKPELPSPNQNGDFAQALRAYQDSFGPLGSSFQYEKFQMLWDEHPVSEIHEYARKEMCRAMMDDSRRVHPNLAYYAQCLATGAARAEGKRSERRGDGKRRNVPKRTVVDFDDPAVKAWMAERSKNGRHD